MHILVLAPFQAVTNSLCSALSLLYSICDSLLAMLISSIHVVCSIIFSAIKGQKQQGQANITSFMMTAPTNVEAVVLPFTSMSFSNLLVVCLAHIGLIHSAAASWWCSLCHSLMQVYP